MKRKTVFLSTLGGLFGALVGAATAKKGSKYHTLVGAAAGAATFMGVDYLTSKTPPTA